MMERAEITWPSRMTSTEAPNCSASAATIDPLGTAFETFDPTGKWLVAAGQESHLDAIAARRAAAGALAPGRADQPGRSAKSDC